LLRRENGIDILKSISAFLVVCIHAPFPGTAGAEPLNVRKKGVDGHGVS
jgi:hypothetical protein